MWTNNTEIKTDLKNLEKSLVDIREKIRNIEECLGGIEKTKGGFCHLYNYKSKTITKLENTIEAIQKYLKIEVRFDCNEKLPIAERIKHKRGA